MQAAVAHLRCGILGLLLAKLRPIVTIVTAVTRYLNGNFSGPFFDFLVSFFLYGRATSAAASGMTTMEFASCEFPIL